MSTKSAFITGLEGFTGHYLKSTLARQGYDVFGTVQHAATQDSAVFECDLNDTPRLTQLIKAVRPDYIVNLAGIAFANHDSSKALFEVNLLGTLSLLEATGHSGHLPQKILLAGSAHVYGNQQESPITESSPLRPNTEYGISKLAMEQTAQLWFERLPIIVARPFNYTGSGQSKLFLPPKLVDHFVREAASIELGNLDVARDWSDVRDVVKIYQLLLESDATSLIVNVCSGNCHPLREVLNTLTQLANHSPALIINPDLVRANEIKELRGDNSLLHSIIGDTQRYALNETLAWMFECASVSKEISS